MHLGLVPRVGVERIAGEIVVHRVLYHPSGATQVFNTSAQLRYPLARIPGSLGTDRLSAGRTRDLFMLLAGCHQRETLCTTFS